MGSYFYFSGLSFLFLKNNVGRFHDLNYTFINKFFQPLLFLLFSSFWFLSMYGELVDVILRPLRIARLSLATEVTLRITPTPGLNWEFRCGIIPQECFLSSFRVHLKTPNFINPESGFRFYKMRRRRKTTSRFLNPKIKNRRIGFRVS